MAWIPLSFHLSILAGILVIFNHFASSETGDVALNKVTGAAGRFYDLFRDSATSLQHGCASRLEAVLCGPTVNGHLLHGAVEYLGVRYCHALAQDLEGTGGASNEPQPHGGYGSSDSAFMYYQPCMQPVELWTSVGGLFGLTPLSPGWPSQRRLSRAMWDWSREGIMTTGVFLFRTWALWCWFTAPLKVMGVLLTAYSAFSILGCLFGANVGLRSVSQMYLTITIDFLQCVQWEAQRHVWDIGVVAFERVYGAVIVR